MQRHLILFGRDADGTGSDANVTSTDTVSVQFVLSSLGVGSLHAAFRKARPTYTGRQPQNRVMAPLCPRLPWLLKHTDCLHRANILWGTSRGFNQRPPLWKRNVGAVGAPLPQQPLARSLAASAHGSSPDGHDLTEKLWSVYHKTKKRTEGI